MKRVCIIRNAQAEIDYRVTKELRSLSAAGYKIDVFCIRGEKIDWYERIPNVKYYHIFSSRSRYGLSTYLFQYVIAFIQFSILLGIMYPFKRYNYVQVNTMPDFLVFTTLLPKLFGAKVLIDLHEPTPELWITKFGKDRLKFLYNIQVKFEQWAIAYVDQAMTVSEALKQKFIERGANPKKIEVIPNVCDDTMFEYQEELKHKSSIFTIIIHGMIEKRYGHDTIIKAIEIVKDRIPQFKLNVLGYGPYKEHLKNIVTSKNLNHLITFFDFLPFEEMLNELRKADIGIVAMERNLYSELIDTNKMYEYIALKIPAISSRLPVVEHNFDDTCLMLFEPGNAEELADCIEELYHNSEKRQSLVKNAYQRYEKMKWSLVGKKYVQLFD